jgi:hypothetical protein
MKSRDADPREFVITNDKFTLLRRQRRRFLVMIWGCEKDEEAPGEVWRMPRFVALSAHAEAGTLSVCTDKLSETRSPKAANSRGWGDEGDLIPESATESIIGELQDFPTGRQTLATTHRPVTKCDVPIDVHNEESRADILYLIGYHHAVHGGSVQVECICRIDRTSPLPQTAIHPRRRGRDAP